MALKVFEELIVPHRAFSLNVTDLYQFALWSLRYTLGVLVIPAHYISLDFVNKSKGVRICYFDYSDAFNCVHRNNLRLLLPFRCRTFLHFYSAWLFPQPTVIHPSQWHGFLSCQFNLWGYPWCYIIYFFGLLIFHTNSFLIKHLEDAVLGLPYSCNGSFLAYQWHDRTVRMVHRTQLVYRFLWMCRHRFLQRKNQNGVPWPLLVENN